MQPLSGLALVVHPYSGLSHISPRLGKAQEEGISPLPAFILALFVSTGALPLRWSPHTPVTIR